MTAIGRYCTETHMFVQEPATLNINMLGFLRWLAVRGWLEHPAEGAPATEPPADRWPWSAFRDEEPA